LPRDQHTSFKKSIHYGEDTSWTALFWKEGTISFRNTPHIIVGVLVPRLRTKIHSPVITPCASQQSPRPKDPPMYTHNQERRQVL
jgi:hypothetical protein